MKFCKYHLDTPVYQGLDTCRTCYDRERKWKSRGIFITTDEYLKLLEKQNGTCFFCNRPPKPGRFLDVDHDHNTGRIRGLLCSEHNRALGVIEKNLDLLPDMIKYCGLEQWSTSGVS